MDQAKSIFNNLPLRLRVTRSQKCAYLLDQTEQRLATDISEHPRHMTGLLKLASDALKIGSISLPAQIVMLVSLFG